MQTLPIQQRDATGWQNLPDSWPACLRRILAARGIQQEHDLTFALKELPKPEQLKGMQAAVALLEQAVRGQWRVMIIADFDTDGATSCAVLMRGLKMLGLQQISFKVPNRFIHGYGLTSSLVDEIDTSPQPHLLITVDNGIASNDGVAKAKQRGMRVLITDHHLPGDTLPDADAIVNPNQPADEFPSKAMAGVGVAFYLLLGFRQHLRSQGWFEQAAQPEPKLSALLDLVALGTVADVVPLDKLNRTLVTLGLQRMRQGRACAGINALLQIAGKTLDRLSAQDLGFAVAPRLNAAGRMEDMGLGIDALLSDEPSQALLAAHVLDDINLQRRSVEQTMQQQANGMMAQLQFAEEDPLMAYCLYRAEWHQGVIGLLASRVKDTVNRPVIVFAPGDDAELKGSARSIAGVHIRDILARVDSLFPDLVIRFGGHAMAAGLSIKLNDFDRFQQAFLQAMTESVNPDVFSQQLVSDGELAAFEMTLALASQLPIAAPWGQGFAEPVFHGAFALVNFKSVGQQADHLKLTVKLTDGRTLTAMAFRQFAPDWLHHARQVVLRYRLDVNEFRQQQTLQLLVEDMFPA